MNLEPHFYRPAELVIRRVIFVVLAFSESLRARRPFLFRLPES